MPDIFTPKQRSSIMSGIRASNTKPELVLRKALFKVGFRYRLHSRILPGKPNIVLSKYCTVVFVNGCFWHGHKACKNYRPPKTKRSFWIEKNNANRRRDKLKSDLLRETGWNVLTVWECQIEKNVDICVKKVLSAVRRTWVSYDASKIHLSRPRGLIACSLQQIGFHLSCDGFDNWDGDWIPELFVGLCIRDGN